jgi:hypothetical protein
MEEWNEDREMTEVKYRNKNKYGEWERVRQGEENKKIDYKTKYGQRERVRLEEENKKID